MTDEHNEYAIWQILTKKFHGYAHDADLIMSYCLEYSSENFESGRSNAQAAIERLREKKFIHPTEANAGKVFYKATDEGKLEMKSWF